MANNAATGAAGYGAAPESFVAGFPPPPYYFTDFGHCAEHCQGSLSCGDGKDEDGKEAAEVAFRFCRPPPPIPPPEVPIASFGVLLQSEVPQMLLDEDARLFEIPDGKSGDLRSEFRRLFGEYVERSLEFLDRLAKGLTGFHEPLRKALRSHRNLLQVLALLRVRQAQEEMIERLETQLKKRRQAADALRQALVLSLEDLQRAQNLLAQREEEKAEEQSHRHSS